MNHYTDKDGYNGIRAQPTWTFRALQPPPEYHPPGAYFTDYPPSEPNLAKKLFIPRIKLAFIFSFNPPRPLRPLLGGRGRLGRIFYSPEDYQVDREYQIHHGETGL